MEPLVFALVLFAALLHASWNALVKSGQDALVRLAMVNAVSALVALFALPLVGIPAPPSWPYLLASVVIHQFYYLFLVAAYRHGDLSVVYPVSRGMAPLLVTVGAAMFLGEHLGWLGNLALGLISAAILSVAISGHRQGAHRSTMLLALATSFTIAGYSIVDGVGGRLSGDVFGYIAWLFVLDAPPLVAWAIYSRRENLRRAFANHWRGGLVGGCLAIGAYGTVIWAMSITSLGYVSALRESSVIIAAIIGSVVLREPHGTRRMAAAAVVAVGIVMLQLA